MPVNHSSLESLPIFKGKIDRPTLLLAIRSALHNKELRFARLAATKWLATYPGDLQVNTCLAQVFLAEQKMDKAVQILQRINSLDPEDSQVYHLLAKAYGREHAIDAQLAYEDLFILGERVDPVFPMAGWRIILRNARKAYHNGDYEKAETYLYQALALNQEHILAGVTHLKILKSLGGSGSLRQFADLYHLRFPDCLIFKLALAEARLEGGEEAEAINLLHQCVAADSAGQVSRKWFGENHPYLPLWPEHFEINFNLPLPAAVAADLGVNRLPETTLHGTSAGDVIVTQQPERGGGLKAAQPKPAAHQEEKKPPAKVSPKIEVPLIKRREEKKPPDWMAETVIEFERLADRVKAPAIVKADGRFPIYVVFSTRAGLRAQYGEQTMKAIHLEMDRLAEVVRMRPGWGSIVFFPDDIECTGKLGIKTVSSNDPWKLKLSLSDLDEALGKKGGRIGAIAIIGGPEVVPFHRLPNPTDDMDEQVLSDNPYATLDSNYFIPEWPVGRLVGESGSDPGLLLQQLRQSIRYHEQSARTPKNLDRLTFWLRLLRLFFRREQGTKPGGSFGYTASVWRRSSLATFRPVGEGQSLLVSPPTETRRFDVNKIINSPLGFYNLHGLAETAEWYGQRDPSEIGNGPDYPVALSLADLPKNGRAPKIVFSEACYGGYIEEKKEDSSLALRFLSIGSMAVVGSTCISYGAVSAPLVGADLLAYLFWSAIRDGYPAGDALSQAKVAMAREMKRRQGFLDGEDQKTLISFVLYGDPLVVHDGLQVSPKRMVRSKQPLSIKTISDHQNGQEIDPRVSERLLQQAKEAVKPYLPGLDHADVKISPQEIELDHFIENGPGSSKKKFKIVKGSSIGSSAENERTVVIFRREVQFGQHSRYNYARVTLSSDGKLMKMAFSK